MVAIIVLLAHVLGVTIGVILAREFPEFLGLQDRRRALLADVESLSTAQRLSIAAWKVRNAMAEETDSSAIHAMNSPGAEPLS